MVVPPPALMLAAEWGEVWRREACKERTKFQADETVSTCLNTYHSHINISRPSSGLGLDRFDVQALDGKRTEANRRAQIVVPFDNIFLKDLVCLCSVNQQQDEIHNTD